MRIGLVACGKQKLKSRTEAQNLYTSVLFRKAAEYCKATYDTWYILSAKHGLLAPSDELSPYDCTLLGRPKSFRDKWGTVVLAQISERGLGEATFYFHAGKAYCQPLLSALKAELPVKGLGIGQQLAWYTSSSKRRIGKRSGISRASTY